MAWIRACVFVGSLSVLVNRSPIEEISIKKGLNQEEPLAPFLFLLMVEGLSDSLKKLVYEGVFEGFKAWINGVQVNNLQHSNDTIIVGVQSEDNLLTNK